MFQNVANDYAENKNHYKDVRANTEEFSSIVKKIFSVKNIIIYIISFMVSMISFGGDNSLGLAPFGLAILAATASSGIPISFVYISTLLGTYVGHGSDITGSYFVTSLVFFATLFIVKAKKQNEVNEKIKLGKNIVISICISRILPMIFTSIYLPDLILAIMLCITTYIFYKVFSNAINVIYEYKEKEVFSIEELMGAGLLIAIAITALNPIHIFGYSLKNILCILVVLILGWKSGILVGTTGGVTIGIVLGIIGNEDPLTVAAFAIAGLLAGVLRKIGKIGVIIGFVVGNIVITYVSNGNVEPIIVFQEILIASVALLLIPKKAEVMIDDVFANSTLLVETNKKTLTESKDTINKLSDMSEAISEIAKSYDESNKEIEDKDEARIIQQKELFIQNLNDNLNGMEENILYVDLKESKEIVDDIFLSLNTNNVLSKDLLIATFAKYNNYIVGVDASESNSSVEKDIKAIIEVINKSYERSKDNLVLKKKIDEKNKNLSKQLQNVSEAISDLADDIKEEKNTKDSSKIDIAKKVLSQRGIHVSDLTVKKSNSGRTIIKLYLDDKSNADVSQEIDVKKIERLFSKVFEEKIVFQKKKTRIENNNEDSGYMFMSGDKYNLKIGIAKSKKHDSEISGDVSIQTKLNDGKYLLAISDGMGSGAEARKSSKMAIKMLERLLRTGFKKDTSIKMINSTLSAKSGDDMYATLDILIMDLYNGNIEFVKNGACPTYVKRNKEVELINSIALPAGIVEDVDLVVYDKDIKSGDIIVMCSDGILDSNEEYLHKELWLKYFLEELQTDDVQQIADLIITEAIDNNYGKEKDDMTVIVAKVE